jgi:hypothetical protein
MDNPMFMGCFKCRRDLQSQGQRPAGREWSTKWCAIYVLHDQVIGADIVELTDVGMIQSRNGACFPLEPFSHRCRRIRKCCATFVRLIFPRFVSRWIRLARFSLTL